MASSILLGLVGSGILASRSPALHEQEGDAQGVRTLYRIIDLPSLGLDAGALPEIVRAAEMLGFAGLNVTHPCKQAVIPLLTTLSADAAALGAVNTVLFRDGQRIGHNTDWFGYAEAFRRNLPGADLASIVQVGAGGAGAAVAHALLTMGCARLSIVDVDPARAATLAAAVGARFPGAQVCACTDLAADVASATGLVNCTPIGMDAHPGLPVPREMLHAGLWVSEIIYFPLDTALLRAARDLGCRVINGGGMAVFQAVEAFRLFTGLTPDADRMQRHFTEMTGGSVAP